MTDENANTADLTIDEKLDRILQRLAALESQGTGTTRPLLDRIIKEMVETRETLTASIEQESKLIRRELGLLREDVRNERMARAELQERVEQLEHRPS